MAVFFSKAAAAVAVSLVVALLAAPAATQSTTSTAAVADPRQTAVVSYGGGAPDRPAGQRSGPCCAYILTKSSPTNWQLVCNQPDSIPGAQPFPDGTIITWQDYVPGVLALCFGRFPYPNPAPYRLPSSMEQLSSPPSGGRCAGQFPNFYQSLAPDGRFMVQCTK